MNEKSLKAHVNRYGFKSVSEFCRESKIHEQTLRGYFEKKPWLFDLIMLGGKSKFLKQQTNLMTLKMLLMPGEFLNMPEVQE